MRSLAETQSISGLAKQLYEWLPGSVPPFGRAFTFADAAAEVGLRGAWQGGSKLPALQRLVEAAYDKGQLGSLILVVFREGIKYRDRGSNPVSREEAVVLSLTLRTLGLRIPELEDRSLLASLPPRNQGRDQKLPNGRLRAVLDGVRSAYEKVRTNPDAQARGYDFQDFLQILFGAFDLEPHSSFRVAGEEIDGSFVLDAETYLVEARWRSKPTAKSDLVVFQSKVTGKSTFSRGVFLSMGPFQPEALAEFNRGHCPGFVVMSKKELERVISGQERLDTLLRRKVRFLAENGSLAVDE